MIKINLLPQQKRAKVTNLEKDLAIAIIAGCCMVGSVLAVDYVYSSRLSSLVADETGKVQIKKELEEKVAKVNSVLSELKSLEARIQAIKDIRQQQGLPVKYIDELVVHLPKNKIWLETFSMGSNGMVALTGVALDNQSFALYVEELRSSKYIARVDTQRTSRKTVGELGLISFQCTIATKPYFETVSTNGTNNG